MFKQDFLGRMSTSVERALFLTDFFLSLGDFREFGLELDKYLSVTPADIVGIVARYFSPENSIVLNVRGK
jgi:predicted Zn-dependent peptidase